MTVLRLATYNIRHGAGADGRLDLARTAATIASLGADAVGLQEVDDAYGARSGFEDQASRLAARLAQLTPQQFRVLLCLADGLLNKQIAYELGVSEATIKAHVSAILLKLNVDSRTQAVIAANHVYRLAGAQTRAAPAATQPAARRAAAGRDRARFRPIARGLRPRLGTWLLESGPAARARAAGPAGATVQQLGQR